MKRFLDEVLDALAESHDSFEDLVFILPNKRAGTFLLNALAKRADKTAFAPRIISIEELLEELSGLRYASRTLQLFELYNAYENIAADPEPFFDFLNWAGPVLQDFNEIDRYMVDSEKLFAYLSDIHEIKQWGIAADSTTMVENYLKFWKELFPLYTTFNSNLESKGFAHAGGIYRRAAEAVNTYLKKASDLNHVFIGFNALTTAESKVIQSFLNLPHNKIYWDMDRDLLKDTDHDASFFLRQYQSQWDRLKKEGVKGISSHYNSPKNIQAIGVPKRFSQAQYVGNLLDSLVSEDSFEPSELAVILSDESLLNPLLHSIPESIQQMNITMGYPLDKIPLAAFFQQVLTVYANQELSGWPAKSVLELLEQPYLRRILNDQDGDHLTALIQELRAANRSLIRPAEVRTNTDLDDHLNLFFPDKPLSAKKAIEHISRIILLLKDHFDSGEKQIELEYLHGFYRVFNQLNVHLADYSFLNDLKSVIPLYENLLQLERIDLRGEPLQGLQIMGMLESRVLDYETVILTSVNEGILPAGKSDSSLIPFDVKREFGLPTYKEKDAIYTYHFYRLLLRAKNIFLLYNTEPDVLLGGEKSRLIMQLQADPIQKDNFQELLAVSKDVLVPVAAKKLDKTPNLLQELTYRLEKGVSPTLLATYIRDPLEFYKKAILDIQDDIYDSTTVDAMALGTLTHKAAEEVYGPLVGLSLSESLLKQQKDRIPQVVESLFREAFPKGSYTKGRNYLAYHVVLQYVNRLIDYDIQATKKHEITILELEKRLELELDVSGLSVPVRLKGVADRIDRIDNQIRVIDYKTGGLESNELRISSWSELIQNQKRQKAFQVLCYALMVNKEYPESEFLAGIISFRNMKRGFVPFEFMTGRIAASKLTRSELDLFKEQLSKLVLEISNASIPFEELADF